MKYTFEEAEKLNPPQDEFSKPRAAIAAECADRIFGALPKPKKMEFAGEFNDLLLFIGAAEKAAAK